MPEPDRPTTAKTTVPLSPRRRRLRWTAALLGVATLLLVVIGLIVARANRPRLYRPDERLEEITSALSRGLPADAPVPRWRDVTVPAGLGAFRNFAGERTSQMPEDMGPGAAWGDFDNDGDDDLFLVSAGGALTLPPEQLRPCEMHENLGNGTFRKLEGFPETRLHGMGASWGDYDGDGFLDLVVTGYNALLLFHNERGSGRFVRDQRLPNPKGFWSGASWGDYDNDRRLDLYVCGYVQYEENEADRQKTSDQLGTFVPYTLNPASYPPGLNRLFHNNPDGSFTDVTEKLGVANPTGRSLGALWHDFDDDGWLDLYVANDVSDNVFYHNNGGTFVDISHAAWVADYRSAMGLAAGDYNRDGDDDLFITHWVAQENALYDNLFADFNASPAADPRPASASAKAPAPAPSGGKTLGTNYGLRFMDINEMKGLGQIALPYVGWGTEFVDLDGDGWQDLVVVNGNTLEAEGIPKRLKPQEPFLFWNRRGEFFHNLAPLHPSFRELHVSRGLAVSDYDRDGAMDLLIVQLGEGVQLLRNEMQTGHWLQLRLRSRQANGAPTGFGDGAKVIARVGDATLRRTVSSVSYLSQSSHTLHFGLGAAQAAGPVEVRWLGGPTNVFARLDADALWELTENDPVPRRIPPVASARPTASATTSAPSAKPPSEKEQLMEFWKRQRGAMDAMKIEKDLPKAMALFRGALELNPRHEDSRYYLGQCLAAEGDVAGALAQLEELVRLNPQSHRGHQQWGTLRARFATSPADLTAAERSLERAHALNPEETGALLVLGEIALLRRDHPKANERLAAACRTNPRAAGGFFLRAYLAWKNGDRPGAEQLLAETRQALGKDWQPRGTTAEGDVKKKQHAESTPLSRFWETWNGQPDPAAAFAPLEAFLQTRP